MVGFAALFWRRRPRTAVSSTHPSISLGKAVKSAQGEIWAVADTRASRLQERVYFNSCQIGIARRASSLERLVGIFFFLGCRSGRVFGLQVVGLELQAANFELD